MGGGRKSGRAEEGQTGVGGRGEKVQQDFIILPARKYLEQASSLSFYIQGTPKISFGYLRSCPTSYISCNHPGERWRTREVAAVQGAPPPLCPTTTTTTISIISSRCTKTNTPQNNFQFSTVIFKTKRKAQSTELLHTIQFATYDLELLLK